MYLLKANTNPPKTKFFQCALNYRVAMCENNWLIN